MSEKYFKDRLPKWIGEAYLCAKEHGFHDREVPIDKAVLLIITEISEAVNADRRDRRANLDAPMKTDFKDWFEAYVKDTVEDELADVVIRCCDWFGSQDIYYPHLVSCLTFQEIGMPFYRYAMGWITILVNNYQRNCPFAIEVVMRAVLEYGRITGIDMEKHIGLKIRYNRIRPRLNGKKY